MIVTGGGEVENTDRIKRIAIHADHVLLIDRRGLAYVEEPSKRAEFRVTGKGRVGFRPDEVVHRHRF